MGLPPGLTPVEAGRMGLWLLGRRNHHAAIKRRRRRYQQRGYVGDTLISRWSRIAAPWRWNGYPGAELLLVEVCGVAEGTAHNWLQRRVERISAQHARELADYIEPYDGPAVARELRAYADRREAELKRPVVGRKRVA